MRLLRLTVRIRGLARVASLISALLIAAGSMAVAQVAVTTYHNDNYRTGWNSSESTLTPANVNSSSFGPLFSVKLDDQVDAQPLVVPGVNIAGGVHDVVYVATENNTVYAIDADAGTVLLTTNLGTPVQYPLGCGNNGPNVGINSTPVIDSSTGTLYVIDYIQLSGGVVQHRVHALDLGTLTDKVTPVVVAGSHTLTDGTTFTFTAKYQRQRPALLLANGNVYAGFGSFCDFSANVSRGWLLGWNAATLSPLSANEVFDIQASSPNTFFLSSIWMSGYGPAADDSGNIVFVTGNSDPSGTTYDGVTNIQESVVKVSANLTSVVDLFTPSNQSNLDQNDTDFGSGGALVLPDQPGSLPHLVVAAGKYGSMYLMNGDSLGGYSPNKNNVLATYGVGGCWCGESYFVDPGDGLARVVSSGGNRLQVWKLQTSPKPKLTGVASGTVSSGVQDPGFFTSVSSNGNASPIIWALSRPVSSSQPAIGLYAFNPDAGGSKMTPLYKSHAGTWPNQGGNSNLVPTVANGKVYVASYAQLQVFGLKNLAKSPQPAKSGAAATPGTWKPRP